MSIRGLRLAVAVVCSGVLLTASSGTPPFAPGRRVLLDAHNCYPYQGRWADRLDRALATGVPMAIEQDLVWWQPPGGGPARSIVSHGEPFTGDEPDMRAYFFERVRPIITAALRDGDPREWPLVTLNLDFKTNEPEHLEAVWRLLGEYEEWVTTAVRIGDPTVPQPLQVRPLLVLTGSDDRQQAVFHDRVPVGGRLRLFGAVKNAPVAGPKPDVETLSRADLRPEPVSNYRRWWNQPWAAVEAGGQQKAGAWTAADAERLRRLVDRAHTAGLWIRFYTLNGHAPADDRGWHGGYNFGSPEAVAERWRAAIAAGVDFIATDQYELFAGCLRAADLRRRRP